jgi:hypothetical protein
LRRPERAEAALADHEHRAVAGHLVEPGGQIGLGPIDGAGDVAVGKLFRLAHVDDNGNRAYAQSWSHEPTGNRIPRTETAGQENDRDR